MPATTSPIPNATAKYSCDHCLAPCSRCQAHLARSRSPPPMANAPSTRFSATNVRTKEPDGGAGLSKATSNGEVEGPPKGATQAPRAHTFFPRPRRVTTRRSRSPPTIVSRHGLESRASIPSKKRIQIAASGKPIASMPIRSDKRPIGEHRHGSLGENCGLQPVIPRTYPTATVTAGMTTTTVRTIANQKSASRFP